MKKLNFNKNIKGKMLTSYVILTFTIIFTMSILIYLKVVNQTKKDYVEATKKEIVQIDRGIDKYINSVAQNVNMLSSSNLLVQEDNRITSYINKKGANGLVPMEPLKNNSYEADVYRSFENIAKTHPDIQDIFIGIEENGGYVQYPAKERNEGYDPRVKDWYKQAMTSEQKVGILDAYKSSRGDISINLTSKIKEKDGKVKAIIGMGISLEELTNMIKKIKIGQNGYIVLVDNKGNILANPKDEKSLLKKC